MTMPEQLSTTAPPRRPFQYSLRGLFGLTCGAACFFSLGRTLGYVDAIVILVGVVVAVGIMEYPRRVHPVTAIMLTLVTSLLLWANLRTPSMWRDDGGAPPVEWLDPVAQSMFSRGWPLAPFMLSLVHGMRFHTSEGEVYFILFLDGLVFVAALVMVRCACEFCFHRRRKRTAEVQPDSSSPSG